MLAVEAAAVFHDIGLPRGIDYSVNEDVIFSGLEKARLPGRFEILSRRPMLVLDGAHNQHAAKCLGHTLDIINGGQWDLIWGMKADKLPAEFIRELGRYVNSLHLCPVPGVVSHDINSLARIAADEGIPERVISMSEAPERALSNALAMTSEDGRVLVTGSLYLAGYLRGCLRKGFDCGGRGG
jgi:dihydrofolate synthase/folylpolyglutamate synthase